MEAKPLEAIPEETVAPAATRCNPLQTKPATAKHPGRVASGKRLAERNCLARVAKKNTLKHRNNSQIQPPQRQTQVQQLMQTQATTQATLFLGLVVWLSPVWACITNVKL